MRQKLLNNIGLGMMAILLSACVSTSKTTTHAFAPKPPKTIHMAQASGPSVLSNIQPALGYETTQLSHNDSQSCALSSFHSKNTVGYEIDESRHIAFKASPKIDVFDMNDAEVEFSLRFTKSFGGKANKRPDCTYGSGFYGQVPFLANDGINVSGLADGQGIKSFIQERLEIREQRQLEREQRKSRGF